MCSDALPQQPNGAGRDVFTSNTAMEALNNNRRVYIALLGALTFAAFAALFTGPMQTGVTGVFEALLSDETSSRNDLLRATFWELRLPRVALACLVGSLLAVAGVVMQALFRNPLAEPGLTGASSGAALAAATVIVFSTGAAHALLLPVAAFAGALAATTLALAIKPTGNSMANLLLVGIAINALCGAGLGLMSYLADDFALRSLTFWQFGSLGKSGWNDMLWAALIALSALAWLLRRYRELNSLLLGEQEAYYLGLDVERFKKKALLATAVCVGAAVACAGLIGFVGLVIPHLLRLLFGPDHRLLLPASTLAAPILLIAADTVARTVVAPAELPIGILTSAIGGPFFIWLLLRESRQ